MVRKPGSIARRLGLAAASVPLCLLVSACGGGALDLANIPPPPATPTPTPTPRPTPAPASVADAYPATRTGTYELLGRTTLPGDIAAGSFQMAVSRRSAAGNFEYELTGPKEFLPIAVSSIDYDGDAISSTNAGGLLGSSYTRTLPFNENEQLTTNLNLKLGYSYASMGSGEWAVVHLDGGSSGDGYGEFVFAAGERTPKEGIPVSGTATYAAKTNLGWVTGPFRLTADFGQRAVSTKIDQDYRYNPNGDSMDYPLAAGIHVEGSAAFSNNGGFDIPIAGTINYSDTYPSNPQDSPPSRPVTGSMEGAFFGPRAEQVGGTFSLSDSHGQVLQDAFIGQQQP